ncbi:RloB family protein [Fulvivirga ligni]|uniref:RloB family protein n=1 Tax=Fulvivirga ligni TaxID=2904246 RepID=UPI001F3B1A29|nr:RloB family protein [Fulvivirga ligni]UII20733.1 RloB family protein [Fulvivirga ligni]
MGRIKREFKRPENKRSAKLIVIATEGRKTERIYFEALAENYDSTKVHVEVIEKLNDNSSPEVVLEQLNSFAAEYNLDNEDELWMVIDRDYQSWEVEMIKSVAQICHQKKGYYLALSNPAFELWLLLHLVDCTELPQNEKDDLFGNAKVSKSKTYSKKMLSDLLRGFNEAKYNPDPLISNVDQAIQNAIKLDLSPKTRWPNYLGTRVYKLVQSILSSSNLTPISA